MPVVAELVRDDVELRATLARSGSTLGRIETFGAARWLEAVKRCPSPATLELRAPEAVATITVEAGEVRDVSVVPASGAATSGRDALRTALALGFGTVIAGATAELAKAPPTEAIEAARRPRIAVPRPGAARTPSAKLPSRLSGSELPSRLSGSELPSRLSGSELPSRLSGSKVASARQTAPMKLGAPSEVAAPGPRATGSIPISELDLEAAAPPPVPADPVPLVRARSSTAPFELRRIRSHARGDRRHRERPRALAAIDPRPEDDPPALPRSHAERWWALLLVLAALGVAGWAYRDALGL